MSDRDIQLPPDVDRHSGRVWNFFQRSREGVFVDVGANHPTRTSLTFFLEQQGWRGVLVEPNPRLCTLLCTHRLRSQIFQTAVGNAAMAGEMDLLLGVSDLHSTLAPTNGDPLSGESVRVTVRTLDDVLVAAGVAQIDFLSLDIEGLELEALQGLDLKKYAPRLILMEDKHHTFRKYFYLRRQGYRLVRRTDLNDWYVPEDSPYTRASMNSLGQRWRLWRKMWLNAPCDNVYKTLRAKLLPRKRRAR